MAATNSNIVEEIVYEVVAQHLGLSRQDLCQTTSVDEDSGAFYRIIVDIERHLEVRATEGDWSFDDGSIHGLVSYYSKLVSRRG